MRSPFLTTRFTLTSFLLVAVFLCQAVVSVPQARADMWGANIGSAIMKQAMERINDQMQGMLLGSLKVAAVQLLNNNINQLIGGGSTGQALFITNYETFLYREPMQETNLYMNDFFTLTTRGKGSSSNYIGVGNMGSGVRGNYSGYLIDQARRQTTDYNSYSQMNLDEYTPSPEVMFAEGDWRAFNAFFSNPANNPYGYTMMAEEAYYNKLSSSVDTQKIKAQSSGFRPVERNGQVVTPTASIEAVTTSVQTMANNIITNATNPAEFLSGVVSAMVNRTINTLIQQGVGQVQANIQREIGNVNGQVGRELNNATQTFGPAARFIPSVLQQTSINVNSSTQAPPSSNTSGL